ncbi:unnamed protein product [Dicrocoelium dendriticum]|nr:unnamed protein product [Dicrocoelium dendriticum]
MRQHIPAILVGIKKGFGLIKYPSSSTHLKVPLSELFLAPSAFNPYNDEDKTTHGGFGYVEVAASLVENGSSNDLSTNHLLPHVVRVGSVLPYRSTLVKLEEIRPPWTGLPLPERPVGEPSVQPFTRDQCFETHFLASPGVLHRHTVCIPVYLPRLATSADSHSALLKFCGAPCLVQCDPEPFLANVLARRILADSDSATVSGRQTPSHADSDAVPSVAVSVESQSSVASSWPSTSLIAQSTILSAPNIAGTLSPAGVTDPTLLLEGLPGANGPLVLLHIWSGSSEAIRRAALLELAHVRILVFRYHVLRKLSNGQPGELDFADSTQSPAENGDAPAMHCKPISIPIQTNAEGSNAANLSGGIMIGYSAQFRIQPQLIGLAIGYRSATIQEARGLPGVRSVDLLHNGIVHVEAETVEACQAVRSLLDYTEAEIPVSPRLASRLIGSKGMNIRKPAASAGVRRAQLLDPLMRKRRQQHMNPQQLRISPDQNQFEATGELNQDAQCNNGDKYVPAQSGVLGSAVVDRDEEIAQMKDESLSPPAFYLLGTRSAVAKMRLLLEFQADNCNRELTLYDSQPLWIADPNYHYLRSLSKSDYSGFPNLGRKDDSCSLKAKSFKPKVSAYRTTLSLVTDDGLPSDDSNIQYVVDDPRAAQVHWRCLGQIRRSNERFFPCTSYREQFPTKYTGMPERRKLIHVPQVSEEKFNCQSAYRSDFCRPTTNLFESLCKYPVPNAANILHSLLPKRLKSAKNDENSRNIQNPKLANVTMEKTTTYALSYTPKQQRDMPSRRTGTKYIREPPFEVSDKPVTGETTYRATYTIKDKADEINNHRIAAGLVTRGGPVKYQRETFTYYPATACTLDEMPSCSDAARRNTAGGESSEVQQTRQFAERNNLWPYVEHKSGCFYTVKEQTVT